jgi:hypothetical protein
MVPTLSFRLSDFSRAETGNWPVPTPECPIALSSDGRLATINGDGFRLGRSPRNRSNNDRNGRGRLCATPPRGQRRRFRPGDCR